jgi:hypothetical protein
MYNTRQVQCVQESSNMINMIGHILQLLQNDPVLQNNDLPTVVSGAT